MARKIVNNKKPCYKHLSRMHTLVNYSREAWDFTSRFKIFEDIHYCLYFKASAWKVAVDNEVHYSAPFGTQYLINSLCTNIIVVFLQTPHPLLLTSTPSDVCWKHKPRY